MPYDYAYGKHDNHKGIFFLATLIVTGLCSAFPILCFKHYSAQERRKKRAAQAETEKLKKRNAKLETGAPRIVRAQSHSPPRTARTPREHRPRRHSTVRLRDTHDFRGRRFHPEDEDDLADEIEEYQSSRRHRSRPQHRYDMELDRER